MAKHWLITHSEDQIDRLSS